MNAKAIDAFFARLESADPEPETEIQYKSPYTLLVAVVLSAQATDIGVNKATGPLFEAADSPEKMVELGEARVRDYIKTIGLYRNKAKNVIALSKALIEEHCGMVPRDRESLEKLAGVGRKTANVVLNVAFGEPTIAVDTPYLPARKSNWTGARRNPARRRTESTEGCPRPLSPSRPSLADSPWPLYLQSPPPGMLALPGQ